MRILIDLQGAQSTSRYRGIGRYSLSLALAMAKNARHHEIWLALNSAFPESIFSIRNAFEGLIPPDRIRIFSTPIPASEYINANKWRVLAAEKLREHFLQQIKPDVIHISSLFEGYKDNAVTSINFASTGIPTAVTLYDLIPFVNQTDYLTEGNHRDAYFRKLQFLKNGDLLLAISEASQIEATQILNLPQKQVTNISGAVDDRFKRIELTNARINQLRLTFKIQRKFVLYAPGGFDSRKNFDGLMTAYSLLSPALRGDYQLVIIGNIEPEKHTYLLDLAKQNGLSKDELVITGYVSDDELVELYNLATLFVFPSKHEGFGLPVLEAMACGTPVIGSNITSIPEVIGMPSALFDPFSSSDISAKISRALLDDTFRNQLREHGLNQAKSFTWDACANRAIDAIEKLAFNKSTTLVSNDQFNSISALLTSIAEINDSCLPTDDDLIQVAKCIAFNSGRAAPKQLLLDISVIVHGDTKTGIQRVVRSLLREFLENAPQNIEVRPIYFSGNRYLYANIFTAKFMALRAQGLVDEAVDFCQDDIYLALDLNAHLTDSVHSFFMHLKAIGVQMNFIVYDILFTQRPDWCFDGALLPLEKWLVSITQVATGLFCISESVADDIRAWLKKNPPVRLDQPFIGSFHLGADIENSMPTKGMPADVKAVLNILKAKPTLLTVGTIEPRKGHTQLLASIEQLWSDGKDINLVIVGKQGWKIETLAEKIRSHPELGKRLFWFESISDEFLETLYTTCNCLIASSEGEGFGLPLIEAAQHKLPIIARDLPVFREVAGEFAYFFTGLTPEVLATAIKNWLTLNAAGKAPLSENMPWLTWKDSTLQLCKRLNLVSENDPQTLSNRQLFVDVSELAVRDARSGVQRVTRSILTELLAHPASNYQTSPVYASVYQGYRYAHQFTSRFHNSPKPNLIDSPIQFKSGDIFLALDLQPQVVIAQQDYYKMLRSHGVKVYFLVHDLLPISHSKYFPAGTLEGFSKWLEVVVQNDGAICVSKSTADELQSWLDHNYPSRAKDFQISWSHNGADIENSLPTKGLPAEADCVLNLLKSKVTFLMVGTIEPRKGYAQTLSAFDKLWSDNTDVILVIVGKKGWNVDDLTNKMRQHKEAGKRFFWLEGITDEYLENLYRSCTCLIAASLGEGFGLPLIEAALHHKLIIARDLPVFREVAGDHAFYFSGNEPDNMAYAIKTWLKLYANGTAPTSETMPYLTWKQSTQLLLTKIIAH